MELPDGKVISGTEWGNFLLWDGGFIKVEIAKKGKKMCHHVRSLGLVHVCMRACVCACVRACVRACVCACVCVCVCVCVCMV